MKKYTILEPEQKWDVVERYLRGVPPHELCREPGVSRPQIQRWLKRARARAVEIFRPARFDEAPEILEHSRSTAEDAETEITELGDPASDPILAHSGNDRELIDSLHEKIEQLEDLNAALNDRVDGKSREHIAALEQRIKKLLRGRKEMWDKMELLRKKIYGPLGRRDAGEKASQKPGGTDGS